MILRMEDTDRSRSTEEYERAVLDDLRWLGLDWDEGPDVGGPYGPYRQTERFDLYARYAAELLRRGGAYECYCTPAELDAERRRAQERRQPYRYSGRCRNLSPQQRDVFIAEGRRPAIRMRLTDFGRVIMVDDLLRGRVEFSPEHLDDYIIVRSDGSPLYNFANVVDDHTMEITHVIRGADHLSNTPKQLVMYEVLGWSPPQFAHLPVILGTDHKKLSKRLGDTAVRDYRRRGYLPEALLNFFALMGWYPEENREVYSVAELVEKFSLHDLGKASPVFDLAKLNWLNGVYMREKLTTDPQRVVDVCVIVLVDRGLLTVPVSPDQRDYVEQVVRVLGDRLKVGEDILAYGDFFFRDVAFDPAAEERYLRQPEVSTLLRSLAERIDTDGAWSREAAEAAVRSLAEERRIHSRELIHPVRVALTGKTAGPSLFDLMGLLGRQRVVQRLRAAAARAVGVT
jgi:glutamyl-tRNA synthetase